jgi:hypothetical protein
MTRIPGSVVTDRIGSHDIQSRQKPSKKDEVEPDTVYAGVKFVPETEQNDGSGDSDDDVPVARLLRPMTGLSTVKCIYDPATVNTEFNSVIRKRKN